MRAEQEIMLVADGVAKRDFPQAFCSPWKLRGLGSKDLDRLLAEAVASRQAFDAAECDRLEREMREYDQEGR